MASGTVAALSALDRLERLVGELDQMLMQSAVQVRKGHSQEERERAFVAGDSVLRDHGLEELRPRVRAALDAESASAVALRHRNRLRSFQITDEARNLCNSILSASASTAVVQGALLDVLESLGVIAELVCGVDEAQSALPHCLDLQDDVLNAQAGKHRDPNVFSIPAADVLRALGAIRDLLEAE